MDFITSETCQNLARSFAGESQARTRYQLAAAVARREDLEVVARIARSDIRTVSAVTARLER